MGKQLNLKIAKQLRDLDRKKKQGIHGGRGQGTSNFIRKPVNKYEIFLAVETFWSNLLLSEIKIRLISMYLIIKMLIV